MTRTNRRLGTKNKAAQKQRVTDYYEKFRNGMNRKNRVRNPGSKGNR